ncbi:MAG: hypothetical protein WCF67_04370 [Chitinophagaceae bacterium]
MRRLIRSRSIILFIFLLLGPASQLIAQIKISGTVYDASRALPLPSVSVLSTGGQGTSTDSLGRYVIFVNERDSISFSFLNRPTIKFPVLSIQNIFQFDISLHVPVNELPAVSVRPRNYKMDSMQNRRDYAKAFDFRKPGIGISTSPTGGVGLDLTEFINMFRFRHNKRMLAFQRRLVQEEQDKFIDQRFTRAVTRKITGLTGDSLMHFMKIYRPSYEFAQVSNEYEFLEYIKLASQEYRAGAFFRKENGF